METLSWKYHELWYVKKPGSEGVLNTSKQCDAAPMNDIQEERKNPPPSTSTNN